MSLGCAWQQEPWDWSWTCGWLDLGSAWQVQCTWPWPQTCLITALLPYDLGFGLSHHLRFCPACLGLVLWDEALAFVPASHDIPVDFPALREMLVLAAPWEDRCPSTKWSLTNFVLLSFLQWLISFYTRINCCKLSKWEVCLSKWKAECLRLWCLVVGVKVMFVKCYRTMPGLNPVFCCFPAGSISI